MRLILLRMWKFYWFLSQSRFWIHLHIYTDLNHWASRLHKEVKATFFAKREKRDGGISPLLVSRFAQNAAFASLGSQSNCCAGFKPHASLILLPKHFIELFLVRVIFLALYKSKLDDLFKSSQPLKTRLYAILLIKLGINTITKDFVANVRQSKGVM